MKKSTIILIAIVYVASIVIVSIFGLKAKIYAEVIPVTAIECQNTTTKDAVVEDYDGKTVISAQLKSDNLDYIETEDGDIVSGTMIEIKYRVLPDNASNKKVKYVYNEKYNSRVKFAKGAPVVLFTGTGIFTIKVMATDGTQKYTEIVFNIYA